MDYKDILNRIDMRELLTTGKNIVGDKPIMLPCFYHEDKQPSMAVYPDHIYCYGCSKHLSVLEYIAEKEGLDLDNNFEEVLKVAEEYTGISGVPHKAKTIHYQPIINVDPTIPLNKEIAIYSHKQLKDKRKWYLSRGISNDVIDQYLLGYLNNAFSIPVFGDNGELLTIRYRRDDSYNINLNKYWGTKGRNQTFIFNSAVLSKLLMLKHGRLCIICEGELDCLRLITEGLPVVTLTNGVEAFVRFLNSNSLLKFKHVWQFTICLDQDEAGQRAAKELLEIFKGRSINIIWDATLGKDVTELINNNGINYFKKLLLMQGVLK